jgi:hypothetical protein
MQISTLTRTFYFAQNNFNHRTPKQAATGTSLQICEGSLANSDELNNREDDYFAFVAEVAAVSTWNKMSCHGKNC